MGQDVANVYVLAHGQPTAPVTSEREIRFHHGDDSIDETLTGLTTVWVDLADAVRTNNGGAFATAISNLSPLVSFTWSADWTNAVHKAFKDVIRPA